MKAAELTAWPVRAGTMMVRDSLLLPSAVKLEMDACSPGWQSVRILDSVSLGVKIAAAGWHLFFIAGHVNAVAFGRGGEKSVRCAVKRIAAQVQKLDFNSLELTEIARKKLLGCLPYVLVSAHPCHIQEGCQLQNDNLRRGLQHDAEWAEE